MAYLGFRTTTRVQFSPTAISIFLAHKRGRSRYFTLPGRGGVGLRERIPRQLRIEYEGAIYHVMSRGDRREPIFEDDRDRETLLKTLAQACEKAEQQEI